MSKDTPKKATLTSMDIAAEKRAALKQVMPEVFRDGAIDFDHLQRALGEWVEPDKERFGLTWPGKAECMKIIQQPSVATLKPVRSESVNFDDTENVFIEGDNLEVLKLLQKAYYGKIKMIYIDPPYNTGKEFIYPDKYSESLETYLAYTGQVDDQGKKFSTNTEAVGRFHSNWLRMMYSRLYLARNLLTEDGVMFISIDDHEVANLRKICDEIFGEECIEQYVWDVREKGTLPKTAKKTVRKVHEYIICAFKNKEESFLNKYSSLKYQDDQEWDNPDNDPRGPWMSGNISRGSGEGTGGSKSFVIENPAGTRFDRNWTIDEAEYQSLLADNRIYFAKEGEGVPRKKIFQNEELSSIQSSIFEQLQNSQSASREITALLGFDGFDYPKPVPLVKRLLQIGCGPNDICLDFFAGSATTAQAVLQANADDGGSRTFIMVQLPEPCEEDSEAFRAGYKTIDEIGRERVRRAAKNIKKESKKDSDLGFRAFSLDRSNFKVWDGDAQSLTDRDMKKQLAMHIDHVSPESSNEDILYELLLKSGYPLTTRVDEIKLANKKVFSVDDGDLLICLEKTITSALIDALADAKSSQVICLDKAFKGNDQLKANAVQTFKTLAESQESEIVFRTV